MVYRDLEHLLEENRVFYHFSQISKIPRPSFLEKAVSDYLFNWAKDNHLEVVQDEKFNLLIRKPASPGYGAKRPIILQAHLDMVCEKASGHSHDFEMDPLHLQLDEDILSTGGRTTLGADNGIGIAIAMAILEDEALAHPPLDVILTTAEEEDMSGALAVEPSWFRTSRIINLDHAKDDEIVLGSSGGKGCELSIEASFNQPTSGLVSYRLTVDGLTGGHSGEDIDKGRAHAIMLIGRLLDDLRSQFDFEVADPKGGNFRLAIPREATVTLVFDPKDLEDIRAKIEAFREQIKKVYEESDPNLAMDLEAVAMPERILSKETSHQLIDVIMLYPNGISDMIGSLGGVESSCNLGELYLKEGQLMFVGEIRSSSPANRQFIYQQISVMAKRIGGKVREFAAYPSWIYWPQSELRSVAEKVYQTLFGDQIKALVLHAGLECGCFSDKIENMEAISIGPNNKDLHAPTERLSVSSTDKIYRYLLAILKQLD
ncbi:dipeptidase D [Streptococcus rupicaprae]|uniref:Dipeptidase D n=1 Tax=Streptococcus rupicaprae TaxID=759619 RepID=A0ABV2FJ82_9STRE